MAAVSGTALRCAYGPAWAGSWALLNRRSPTVRSAALLAVIIWTFELVILPRSGATPQLHEWPSMEIPLDLTNALVYAAVAGATLAFLDPNPASD